MTSYPNTIKNFTTKTNLIDDVLAEHVNDLQNEVMAIETELGILPKGAFSSVRARIEDVESDISSLLMVVQTGWIPADTTWRYASSTTFTVSGDVTSIFPKGTKIKLTQTTVKYFYVVDSSYTSPNTTVTITGGSDYSLANAAITSAYYSYAENPQGFPGWFNYTPAWTTSSGSAPSIGNGSITGRFNIMNKTVTFIFKLVFGSTTSGGNGGNWNFSLPVYCPDFGLGIAHLRDAGVNNYERFIRIEMTANMSEFIQLDNATNNNTITYNTPFTWGNGDNLLAQISYNL